MKIITSLNKEERDALRGKKVIVRVDFNVQVFGGAILDDLRIRKTLPTVKFLRELGARLVLVSHIESKDGTGLAPIALHINAKYSAECGEVKFVVADDLASACADMKDGDVVLLENLRTNAGEKENSKDFAQELVDKTGAEVYVNDAFAVSHRKHASVVALPALFPNARYAGIQLAEEIANLSSAFNPEHPFIFILGGAKFDTKLPLIEKFSAKADKIYLGGALLNDILKAKGYQVGHSLVSSASGANGGANDVVGGLGANGSDGNSDAQIDISHIINNPKLIIPTDVVVENQQSGDIATVEISNIDEEDMIMDVGPSFTSMLVEDLRTAKFVLWNGPMGNYEKDYKDQTLGMAKAIYEAGAGSSGVKSVIGGGDTTAAIAELGFDGSSAAGKNMFVSTGGGAMLEYLQNETLPGLEALG